MSILPRSISGLLLLSLAGAFVLRADAGATAAATTRTVHVTVTDGKGTPVTDLTAADFVVKEGGKEYEVVKAGPATARMRLALAVEERLIAEGSIRLGIFELVKRVAGAADISLITIGLSNKTVVDYTDDINKLVTAINQFTLNPGRDSNLAEGVLEIAKRFSAARPERPVLVVVALSGGQAGVEGRTVLEELGRSGATMHSVTLLGGGSAPAGPIGEDSGREQVLGDGPRQSGGRRVDVGVTTGVPKALHQVADDLLAQYAVTYVLPDGVKPNKRFSIGTKRRGVSLRSPSTIPDR